jgi:hypothetical protein
MEVKKGPQQPKPTPEKKGQRIPTPPPEKPGQPDKGQPGKV